MRSLVIWQHRDILLTINLIQLPSLHKALKAYLIITHNETLAHNSLNHNLLLNKEDHNKTSIEEAYGTRQLVIL